MLFQNLSYPTTSTSSPKCDFHNLREESKKIFKSISYKNRIVLIQDFIKSESNYSFEEFFSQNYYDFDNKKFIQLDNIYNDFNELDIYFVEEYEKNKFKIQVQSEIDIIAEEEEEKKIKTKTQKKKKKSKSKNRFSKFSEKINKLFEQKNAILNPQKLWEEQENIRSLNDKNFKIKSSKKKNDNEISYKLRKKNNINYNLAENPIQDKEEIISFKEDIEKKIQEVFKERLKKKKLPEKIEKTAITNKKKFIPINIKEIPIINKPILENPIESCFINYDEDENENEGKNKQEKKKNKCEKKKKNIKNKKKSNSKKKKNNLEIKNVLKNQISFDNNDINLAEKIIEISPESINTKKIIDISPTQIVNIINSPKLTENSLENSFLTDESEISLKNSIQIKKSPIKLNDYKISKKSKMITRSSKKKTPIKIKGKYLKGCRSLKKKKILNKENQLNKTLKLTPLKNSTPKKNNKDNLIYNTNNANNSNNLNNTNNTNKTNNANNINNPSNPNKKNHINNKNSEVQKIQFKEIIDIDICDSQPLKLIRKENQSKRTNIIWEFNF